MSVFKDQCNFNYCNYVKVKDKRIWMNINYTEIEKFRTISFIFEIREELYKN